jgi:NADH:ubiquinone oxidoreductase subunit 2 (subunit N)
MRNRQHPKFFGRGPRAGAGRDAARRSDRVAHQEAGMKYLRIGGAIFGALCVLMGVVWILQGINVLPGSFMTGDIAWSYRGGVLALAGLVLLFISQVVGRKKRS